MTTDRRVPTVPLPAPADSSTIEEHLRAASDAILLLLTEVTQLESHKRAVPPGEARFDELAAAVRDAAQSLARFTEEEEAWARAATADRTELLTIDESDNAPDLGAILERWRAIERQLDTAEVGTAEARRLFAEFQRARDEYMTAFRALQDRDDSQLD
jgi:hypothetical protein